MVKNRLTFWGGVEKQEKRGSDWERCFWILGFVQLVDDSGLEIWNDLIQYDMICASDNHIHIRISRLYIYLGMITWEWDWISGSIVSVFCIMCDCNHFSVIMPPLRAPYITPPPYSDTRWVIIPPSNPLYLRRTYSSLCIYIHIPPRKSEDSRYQKW